MSDRSSSAILSLPLQCEPHKLLIFVLMQLGHRPSLIVERYLQLRLSELVELCLEAAARSGHSKFGLVELLTLLGDRLKSPVGEIILNTSSRESFEHLMKVPAEDTRLGDYLLGDPLEGIRNCRCEVVALVRLGNFLYAGDQRAGDLFARRHMKWLRGFLRIYVEERGRASQLDDVVQEAWGLIVMKLRDPDPRRTYDPARAGFHTWAKRWAGFAALRWLRKEGRSLAYDKLRSDLRSPYPDLEVEEPSDSGGSPDGGLDPAASLLQGERFESIRSILFSIFNERDGLPLHQLVVFLLNRVLDFTPAEIVADWASFRLPALVSRLRATLLRCTNWNPDFISQLLERLDHLAQSRLTVADSISRTSTQNHIADSSGRHLLSALLQDVTLVDFCSKRPDEVGFSKQFSAEITIWSTTVFRRLTQAFRNSTHKDAGS
jgi:DNA-directed RNA polymerase specialized sigma24 family protein